nr:hypothetical protein [uncultured Mediterraneibacter sp.]
MLQGLAADTSIIAYLMAAVGILGILAKIINQFTLRRLLKAAGNMTKSTHRLIKLVRAKYEHACMIRDSVENVDAFVEKYIYEYRGFLFRIHTWRQIERLSVWFAGILAALGASVLYFSSGFTESVYQYIAAGAAEVVLLAVVMRLTDEPYKINALKMYMVDYLENICTFRLRRQNSRERESIDVIASEGNAKSVQMAEETAEYGKQETRAAKRGLRTVKSVKSSDLQREGAYGREEIAGDVAQTARNRSDAGSTETIRKTEGALASVSEDRGTDRKEPLYEERDGELPINIEGEPRQKEKGEAARQAVRHAARGGSDDERPALREEAIRQILEEFLA